MYRCAVKPTSASAQQSPARTRASVALVVGVDLDALLHESGHPGGATGLERFAHPLGNLLGAHQVDTVTALLEVRHLTAHPLRQFVRQGRGRGDVAIGRDQGALSHASNLP